MTQLFARDRRMSIATVMPDGQPVHLHVATQGSHLRHLLAARLHGLPEHPPPASLPRTLRLLLTEGTDTAHTAAGTGADAVLHLSRDCPVQTFPPDLGAEPIRLRLPLSRVALHVALEYVAGKSKGTGHSAAHPR